MTNEELVNLIQNGINPSENLEALYNQNRPFIYNIAKHYINSSQELEDLMQESYIGLVKAVEHYDDTQECGFLTCLKIWLKQELLSYINNSGGSLSIPDYMRYKVLKYRKHRSLSDAELCSLLDVTKEELKKVKAVDRQMNYASLDAPISESSEGDELSLMDILADGNNRIEVVTDDIAKSQADAQLWKMVDELEEDESLILHQHYEEDKPLSQVARDNHISDSIVRASHQRALRNLRRESAKLKRAYEDIYSFGIKSCGTETFKRTWMSSTEISAFRDLGIDIYD